MLIYSPSLFHLHTGKPVILFKIPPNHFILHLSTLLTEEEQWKEKDLISREAEAKCVELVTSLSQPVRANHITWSDDGHRQQPHQAPPPSLPPQVPIAVIPMVPVVTATPSVPPLPLATPIAAAATLNGPPQVKKSSSPPTQPQQVQQPPTSPHLLCTPHMKVEAAGQQLIGGKPGQSQPQVQIQYPTSITNNSGSQHALAPHQAPPTSQSRTNGVTIEDMRGMEGKRRPGGSVDVLG